MRTSSTLPLASLRREAHPGAMLSAHCSRHGRTVLVPTSAIDGIDNTPRGIVVRWHCACGERGTTHFARRVVPPSAHAAPLC